MAAPEPRVPLKDHCSILHDNVLYVYSPDAFQTLSLTQNATWSQEENGVSVTGATCVKGGVDGNGSDPALYVVGGVTNSSVSNYSGIQRYSIPQKKWQTITPITAVTANRVNHGSVYLNASSSILIYGGSQNGDAGLSTETFLMLMYPPYRVQAYSSIAPAVKKPYLLSWDNDRAVMVGGSPTNQNIFTFHPDPGWLQWGVALPNALPDPSVGQVNLQILDDGSRVLQTYYLSESPNRVTRNVLANPGLVVASYGQTIGDQSTANSRLFRRQSSINDYPAYNNTNAPTDQRTDAVLATGGALAAIVGGAATANNSVAVFNTTGNTWIDPVALFGETQKPLTTSSSSVSATPTPTASPTEATSAAATTSAAAAARDGQSNGLAILGGVLGGICGLAAILIILLLWLRSVRKRKRMEIAARKNHQASSSFPNDKQNNTRALEKNISQPLSKQAQPMGRSPVPSAVISEPDSVAIFGARGEKGLDQHGDNSGQSFGGSKLNPNHANNNNGGFFKSNNKTPMQISKPMLPDLGDYQERPSVDLGHATPSNAPVLPPVGSTLQHKEEQRKTDEGWAKYFSEDPKDKPALNPDRIEPIRDSYAIVSPITPTFAEHNQPSPRPSTSKGGGGGFWPGAGVPTTSSRPAKLPIRDSEGNLLNHSTVPMASPSLATGHENPATRNLSVAPPAQAKLSRGDSISTTHSSHSSDDGYEDEEVDAYSDTRDSTYQQNAWNPIGNTWSGPSQRPLRPPSVRIGASAFPPPPTNLSEKTVDSSGSGDSSIPVFPMPAATLKRDAAAAADQPNFYNAVVHHPPTNPFTNPYAHARKSSNTMHGGPPVQDYFGPPPDTATSYASSHKLPDSTDMSWLNLGTPAHVHAGSPARNSPAHIHGAAHTGDAKDPA